MKLYKLHSFAVLEVEDKFFALNEDWDDLINREQLHDFLLRKKATADLIAPEVANNLIEQEVVAPIGTQEVWAAGVTYLRSRDARMEESRDTGGANFYDKVYEAERPELFFKSYAHRVAGHRQAVHIRRDSAWNVPEPELTLFINSFGTLQGYTIGNDMSSRSIEGENPLYLPQAKMYDRSAALGPGLYIPKRPIEPQTNIHMQIKRKDKLMYSDQIAISRIKRSFHQLIEFLYREYSFPQGTFLMTGTCLVPPNDFTLEVHDEVVISIDRIGTLSNTVSFNKR